LSDPEILSSVFEIRQENVNSPGAFAVTDKVQHADLVRVDTEQGSRYAVSECDTDGKLNVSLVEVFNRGSVEDFRVLALRRVFQGAFLDQTPGKRKHVSKR
jgi:hypothetical protein